ncbi:alpha/beta fold hydrolase [Streptomyces sp. JJ66]|uniref:alpha/beta hydrolase n=1 Tax=Streptomyces sp. JJ66 TaxID=2803843 RepID=UPI001C58EB5D|nr:alpha/beta hydrolase [Streptomyces sp. JJ66]MBW1601412.1 alpha/beta fold hydrolase [Streptomyces sp. JJ66]
MGGTGISGRRYRRAVALAAVAVLSVTGVSGCGGGAEGKEGAAKPSATAEPSARGVPGADGAPGSAAPPLPARFTGQRLEWGECEAPEPGQDAPGEAWRCATLTAPLDYHAPGGETIELALIRREASEPEGRVGSLLFNFGGPGGSGVASLPGHGDSFATLGRAYDLVGFDPRGVGASSQIRCLDDAGIEDMLALDATPDTAAEEKTYLDQSSALGAACGREAGGLLPHVGTADAARDMDLMRHVLGDNQLHYLGFSYGTTLGGTYAHLFPRRVGRMVLDAAVDPTANTVAHLRHQTTGFQRALENYLASTGADPAEGSARLAALLEELDAKPLPASGGRELTESLARTGIVAALYREENWPLLTRALSRADDGDGSTLLALADFYNGRDQKGRYDASAHAQRAISCADDSARPTPEDARGIVPEFEAISPVFGAFLAWDAAGWCAGWPVAGARETPDVSAAGAAPIVVVGTTGDPATPVEGAERMAEELGGDVGVLLTYDGEGHGAYLGDSACVRGAVDAYLLDGDVPEDGTRCA